MPSAQVDKLTRQLESSDPDVRARASAGLSALERRVRAKAETAEVQAGLDETEALAAAKGDTIERTPRRVRVSNRDVLKVLLNSGTLPPACFRAGMEYRRLYEDCDPERGLAPPALDGGRGRGMSDQLAERVERSKARLAKVQGVLQDDPRARMAVAWVAGANRPVSAMATSGHLRAGYTAALVRGLSRAAALWGLD